MSDESTLRDAQLAGLLAKLTDLAQRGEPVDIDAVCREHPDVGDELRQLWGAVMVADAVAADSVEPTQPAFAADVNLLQLPCRLGDYELQEELGRGGMGVVFRARQNSLNREVALKMILRGPLASADELARFRGEAEAAAGLDHAGIVQVYEVDQCGDRPFFTMRFVAGETLSQRMAAGPIPAKEAARLLAAVARAVHFAHERGVLHRDLKPSNILIDNDGQPHITDFGLARRWLTDATSITKTGAVLGTPAYMSPEQAAGQRGRIGPASDVYSLGTMLYQMLTGTPPFQADSPVETVFMVLEQDPVPPRIVNPRVDRGLEMIALKCLQKPPDLRYKSASALADDLDAWLKDEPLSASTGRLGEVFSRLFRETHHAAVLENWGLLWMWHSLVLLVACVLTNVVYLQGIRNRWYYVGLWTAGFWAWAAVFWLLRRRMGPVTFVERQIAHIWGASMIAISLLFGVEYLLHQPVLYLSPVLGLVNGMVFFVKAGILSGWFYLQSAALFFTAFLMARYPDWAHLIFGVVSTGCFFVPGWQYHRQRFRQNQAKRT